MHFINSFVRMPVHELTQIYMQAHIDKHYCPYTHINTYTYIHMSWDSQICNILIIVYGFINVLLYHVLDIIYYICINTAYVCTHVT